MRRMRRLALAAMLTVAVPGAARQAAPVPQRDSTAVTIRRAAGLAPETADGAIEILDVGHDPLSTMLSIVARRTVDGWSVSYACASSPNCAPDADHEARNYSLTREASAEVDRLLDTLRTGVEPDGQMASADIIGGYLVVRIDDRGFRRRYHRVMNWGTTLGRLETLLSRQ